MDNGKLINSVNYFFSRFYYLSMHGIEPFRTSAGKARKAFFAAFIFQKPSENFKIKTRGQSCRLARSVFAHFFYFRLFFTSPRLKTDAEILCY